MGTTPYPEDADTGRGSAAASDAERTGVVERIHTAPESGTPMESREACEAVAGRGLRGDRYFDDEGYWSLLEERRDGTVAGDVTFIEAEALEAIAVEYDVDLEPRAHRRNVTTRDVSLNHLPGERFRVGEAVFEGIGLCEPCGYMEGLAGTDGVAAALVHRGGLDARVVESGTIRPGDEIRW
jgi:hypothetical protein